MAKRLDTLRLWMDLKNAQKELTALVDSLKAKRDTAEDEQDKEAYQRFDEELKAQQKRKQDVDCELEKLPTPKAKPRFRGTNKNGV